MSQHNDDDDNNPDNEKFRARELRNFLDKLEQELGTKLKNSNITTRNKNGLYTPTRLALTGVATQIQHYASYIEEVLMNSVGMPVSQIQIYVVAIDYVLKSAQTILEAYLREEDRLEALHPEEKERKEEDNNSNKPVGSADWLKTLFPNTNWPLSTQSGKKGGGGGGGSNN